MKVEELSAPQIRVLTILRLALGWYIMFQGLMKFYNPTWTAKPFLEGSEGFLSGVFQAMAAHQSIMAVIDFLNIYGQLAIGLGLILGLFATYAAIAAIIMFLSYYLAYPPFIGSTGFSDSVLINGLFIEIMALVTIWVFPTSQIYGLDRMLRSRRTSNMVTEKNF